jgi:hypothetical protein
MNHMNIEGRILQSLRPRRDGVLLRSEVRDYGSASQVSAALSSLLARGLLVRIAPGVYAKADAVERRGRDQLLGEVLKRKARRTSRSNSEKLTSTARQVRLLARRAGVRYRRTYSDRWADAVTRLAGDEVGSDSTDELLVALTRAGELSPREMTKLLVSHHRELKGV